MDIGTSYRRKTQTAVPHHVENRRAVFRWVPFGRLEFSRLARVDACQPSATSTSACDRRRYEPLPTDAHLISWACLCPRNDESAGKRRSTRIRKSSPWLKTTRVQCVWAAPRERHLPQRPVSPHQSAARAQKCHPRRRCLDPHRRVSHAQRPNFELGYDVELAQS